MRNLLVNGILAKKKLITLADIFKASRIDRFPEAPKCYPLSGSATVAGTSFVIDREFPEELSYLVSTFGPPRHGLYVPVPLTLKQFPIEFRNGSWSEKLFKLKKAKKRLDMKKLESVEAIMLKKHQNAMKEARKILKAGGWDAKDKAAQLLDKAFRENLKTAHAARKGHK